ncbi:MAG: EAL domain-containing protein [Pseudolabrys sp.]
MVLPEAFMPGVQESTLRTLAEMSLINALKTRQAFSKLGINLRVTVNVPAAVLDKLPLENIVKSVYPSPQKWAGLLDEFGRGYSALARLDALPFAEIKLDRAFVSDCGSDRVKAPLCKQAIDLAHNLGANAVAMGIEKAADTVALVSMGGDFGQGFLLGQPMPEERFVSLLR